MSFFAKLYKFLYNAVKMRVERKSMMKSYMTALGSLLLLSLTACSTFTSSTQKQTQENTVQLTCGGVSYCQFDRIDDIHIVDADNDWITVQAIRSGVVKLKDTSLKNGRLKFDVSLKAQLHEVSVKFYPISEHQAQKFTLIHDFKAGQNYTLHMYRKYIEQKNLLEMASPSPLCIDLKQGEQTIRTFCRSHDAVLGFGDFIEQKVNG